MATVASLTSPNSFRTPFGSVQNIPTDAAFIHVVDIHTNFALDKTRSFIIEKSPLLAIGLRRTDHASGPNPLPLFTFRLTRLRLDLGLVERPHLHFIIIVSSILLSAMIQ